MFEPGSSTSRSFRMQNSTNSPLAESWRRANSGWSRKRSSYCAWVKPSRAAASRNGTPLATRSETRSTSAMVASSFDTAPDWGSNSVDMADADVFSILPCAHEFGRCSNTTFDTFWNPASLGDRIRRGFAITGLILEADIPRTALCGSAACHESLGLGYIYVTPMEFQFAAVPTKGCGTVILPSCSSRSSCQKHFVWFAWFSVKTPLPNGRGSVTGRAAGAYSLGVT